MQYTKPMIDLVYEIRRRVDADMKPSVKMANPEVLKELAEYHQRTNDTIIKTLIKELLFMAGPVWGALIELPKIEPEKIAEHPKQVVKVYRGQTILVDAPHNPDAKHESSPPRADAITDSPASASAVRLYRGNPIVG
jgi:hypothetical protein